MRHNFISAAMSSLLSLTFFCAAPGFAAPSAPNTAPTTVPTQTHQAAPEIDGYSLYQTSAVLGDKDVLITSNAIKVVDHKNGLGIMAQAPQWKVFVLNPRTRRLCSYDLPKYPGIGKEIVGITGGAPLNNMPLKRGAKATINGVAAITCETTKSFEEKQQKDRERGFAGPRFAKWGELLIADKGPLDQMPKQAKSILCRFYGVPEFAGQGLPLRFKYVDLADELHTLLLTNSFKPMKLAADTFSAPKDWAVVADISKLEDKPKNADSGPRKAIQTIKKNSKQ